MQALHYQVISTHQVECFTVWFNFMFFHVLYKAAVCVSEKKEGANYFFMSSVPLLYLRGYSELIYN